MNKWFIHFFLSMKWIKVWAVMKVYRGTGIKYHSMRLSLSSINCRETCIITAGVVHFYWYRQHVSNL